MTTLFSTFYHFDQPLLGGGRSVLKIHFFIESGLKMIQFKTKSRILIQKNIHSIEPRIFNKIINSKFFEGNRSKFQLNHETFKP